MQHACSHFCWSCLRLERGSLGRGSLGRGQHFCPFLSSNSSVNGTAKVWPSSGTVGDDYPNSGGAPRLLLQACRTVPCVDHKWWCGGFYPWPPRRHPSPPPPTPVPRPPLGGGGHMLSLTLATSLPRHVPARSQPSSTASQTPQQFATSAMISAAVTSLRLLCGTPFQPVRALACSAAGPAADVALSWPPRGHLQCCSAQFSSVATAVHVPSQYLLAPSPTIWSSTSVRVSSRSSSFLISP